MASACVFMFVGAAGNSYAQEVSQTEDVVIKTRSVKVTSTQIVSPYVADTGVNSGKSTIEGEAVSDNSRSSGDANAILRILPQLQFDNSRNDASREKLQDIHPLDISISGGKYYENNISIDGIGVNTRLDTTDPNPASVNEVAGSRAQTQWVDTSQIEKIEVLDSNVSAEHGQFTGGVLNITTRDPIGIFGVRLSSSCTGDDLTSFKISKATKEAFGANAAFGAKPEYSRCNIGGSVYLPEIDGTKISITHNEAFSKVTNYKAASYGGGEYRQTSESKSTTIKALRNFGDLFALSTTITHSPYSSEFQVANQVQNQIISYGGGDRAVISIKNLGTPFLGAKDWSFNLSYSDDDTSRRAAENHYSWPSAVPEFKVCSGANCSFGGFGNIDQNEKELNLNTKMAWNVPFGTLNVGAGYEKIDATKKRATDGYAYLTSDVASTIVCATDGDKACRTGNVALINRLVYKAYDIDVSLETANLWSEYQAKIGNLTLRPGVRVEYDSFLENTDIAPRFTASYDFGKFEIFAGANRYYSKSFLSFAIREQMPDTYRYARSPIISSGKRTYSDENWNLTLHSKATTYKNANLNTPYSDEIAFGINAHLPWEIDARVKYINRKGKDIIVAGDDVTATYINTVTGKTTSYRTRSATNDGHSDYENISIELFKNIGNNHRLSFNTAWSDLKSYGNTYFDSDIYAEDMVYYQGNVISFEELYNIKQQSNFNTPLMANLSLNSKWLGGKLKSNLSVRWRDKYDTIADSLVDIKVNNVTYDVYKKITYKASTELDLKLDYEFINVGRNKIMLTADVTNLLDNTQYPEVLTLDEPYEKGRVIWLGASYKF